MPCEGISLGVARRRHRVDIGARNCVLSRLQLCGAYLPVLRAPAPSRGQSRPAQQRHDQHADDGAFGQEQPSSRILRRNAARPSALRGLLERRPPAACPGVRQQAGQARLLRRRRPGAASGRVAHGEGVPARRILCVPKEVVLRALRARPADRRGPHLRGKSCHAHRPRHTQSRAISGVSTKPRSFERREAGERPTDRTRCTR